MHCSEIIPFQTGSPTSPAGRQSEPHNPRIFVLRIGVPVVLGPPHLSVPILPDPRRPGGHSPSLFNVSEPSKVDLRFKLAMVCLSLVGASIYGAAKAVQRFTGESAPRWLCQISSYMALVGLIAFLTVCISRRNNGSGESTL